MSSVGENRMWGILYKTPKQINMSINYFTKQFTVSVIFFPHSQIGIAWESEDLALIMYVALGNSLNFSECVVQSLKWSNEAYPA